MKIVRITDSIGWSATTGYWPWVQEDLIQIPGVRVIDNIQNGQSYDNSTNLLAVLPAALAAFGITEGDIAVLDCGLHDIENTAGVCATSKPLFASNLTAVFTLIAGAIGPTGKMFWCTITSVDETYTTIADPKRFEADVIDYNAIATPIALSFGATIVDTYTAGLGTNKAPDGTHQDEAGREVLARAVCSAIRTYLGSTESYAPFVKYGNSTKRYRVKLPQENIHLSTENSPLIINETGLSTLFTNAAFSDGRDIVATSGASKLPIAKSVFDTTNKKLSFAIAQSKRSLIRNDQLYLQCGDAAVNESSDTSVFSKKDIVNKLCDIESSMLGYFPLLGNSTDYSAYVDHGTPSGGCANAANGRGKVFDGINGMITLTKGTSYQNLTAFSIEVVFTPTAVSGSSGLQGLFTKCYGEYAHGFFLSLYNNRLHFGGYNAALEIFPSIYSAVGSIINGFRHVMTATYDGTTVNLYLDGCNVGSAISTVDTAQEIPAIFGRQYYDNNNYYFAGTIHSICTWNVCKTPAQVAQLTNHEFAYHAGKYLNYFPMLNLHNYSGASDDLGNTGSAVLNSSKKGYDFTAASKMYMTTTLTTPYQNISGMTMYAIITPASDPANYGGVLSKLYNFDPQRGWAICVYNGGKVMARVQKSDLSGTHDLLSAGGVITPGTKYLLALTHDGAKTKLILDGIVQDSYAMTLDSAQEIAITIGRFFTNADNYYFDGTIHEWGAVNYAMSEAELKTIWDEQTAISQAEQSSGASGAAITSSIIGSGVMGMFYCFRKKK
jgi:hypothetical protein